MGRWWWDWMTGLLAASRRRCEARRTTWVKTMVCIYGLRRIGGWMWGQLRTMDDGLDWPSFLVVDVPKRCQSPHKFRGHSKRRIMSAYRFPFLESVAVLSELKDG